MMELLEIEVDKEVNIDFNEVYQRMTLDSIGESSPTSYMLQASVLLQ